MLIPVTYNLRSLLVRKATTIATALGIGLVVFVLSSSLMLGKGIRNTLVSNGSDSRAIVLRKGSDTELASGIDANLVGLVLAGPGVKRDEDAQAVGAPDVVVVASLDKMGGEGYVSNILIRGVQPAAFKVRPEVRIIEGRRAQPGTDEVIVGKGIAGRFQGTGLGQSFEMKKNRPVKVVGIFEANRSSVRCAPASKPPSSGSTGRRGPTSTSSGQRSARVIS